MAITPTSTDLSEQARGEAAERRGESGDAGAATRGDLQALAKRHLWMHFTRMGVYAEQRRPGDRARRRLLRVRRARQALPRRALGAVLREHRPRPRRAGAGRRAPGRGARLLHELELRPPALDRAGRADRRARAREPEPRVLHLRRLGGGRVGVEAREGLPRRQGRADAAQADLAPARLPRHLDGGADGDRRARAARRRSSR